METSSPLAAMQHSTAFLRGCGFQAECPTSYPTLASSQQFGQNNFNFRDLSMTKSQSDYFSMRPVRGSSPTTSLAADLSQNFHIDQSPQLPTPRRALFFRQGLRESMSTPPPPSSSPGLTSDCMDMSPLPHKPPFAATVEVQLQSPTPELTPADLSMVTDSSPVAEPTLEVPDSVLGPEHRKPTFPRPQLLRSKNLSTSAIPIRPSPESRAPPFRFGNGFKKQQSSLDLSLAQAFEESPPQDKAMRPNITGMMGAIRTRQPLAGAAGSSRYNGSPGQPRRPSNSSQRPRKQFRRSLSMFEHPDEVMKDEKSYLTSGLPSITDNEAQMPQLPHFMSNDPANNLPRISKQTLIDVLDNKYSNIYDKFVIIDCRFEYEYKGGHIEGAVNFNDKEQLAARLFDLEPTQKALLIFHCEYSAHRAPIMARSIRERDRMANANAYPNLTYPDLYILDGGYSSFFGAHRERCFPQSYVEMGAKEHEFACERGLGKVKQRSKLVRAQTFAFGQHSSPQMEDSPTAPSRMRKADSAMEMDLGLGTDCSLLKFPSRDLGFWDVTRRPSNRVYSH